ncbi:hypothetical protein [Streptomyces sp. NPDC004296]|uniref:hypothetical protein n=1 Tax=Streptomyces sp. NPDC004296 TaxID=3364697 RepID=UPI0036B5E0E1
MRLLAGGPSAEGAWLVVLVLRDCPLEPAGGLEPRAVERLVLLQRTVALEEGLLELAAVAGSLDAAVAFVVAKDAGTDGYVIVLHCLVQADSAAWIADVLAMLAALARVELGTFCLGAAATDAHRPGAHPAGAGPASAGLDPAAGRGAPGRAGPWTAFVRRRVGMAPAADGGARALSGLGCPPGT